MTASKTEPPFDEFLIAQGLIWRYELSHAGVAATTGVAYTGITVGTDELVILQRAYSSTESAVTIELFEATFTGGTDPRILNRRLRQSADAQPCTVKVGVTPGTLGNVLTGVTLRAGTATGSAQLQISGDDSRLYLKAGASYVVRYTNLGANPATISNSFDCRKVLGGSWDRTISNI